MSQRANPSAGLASEQFKGAMKDAVKAWTGANLASISNPDALLDARAKLAQGDPRLVASMVAEMVGPVAQGAAKNAFNARSHKQLELTKIVVGLALRGSATDSGALDPGAAADLLALWIDGSELAPVGVAPADLADAAAQAKHAGRAGLDKISVLVSRRKVPSENAGMRLALAAPAAPALAMLDQVSRMPQAVLDLLKQTRRAPTAPKAELSDSDVAFVEEHAERVFGD